MDETTGTLMDVFTKPADTTVTDSFEQMNGGLSPNTTYYYRIMVMDEFGKIAGSNVLAVTTDKYPPVKEMYTLEPIMNFPGDGNLGVVSGVAFSLISFISSSASASQFGFSRNLCSFKPSLE